MSLEIVLERFRTDAVSKRDLGDRFERLIVAYLKADPLYTDQFTEVWLWKDWPHRGGLRDTGIDAVAKRQDGEYCAIQCKFYDPAATLQKSDIDSFFTASGKQFETPEGMKNFASRLIVSTTDKWSKNAEEALRNQAIPVTRLRVQDLAASPVDWEGLDVERIGKLQLQGRNALREHQRAALSDVLSGFMAGDRGKLIMACGSGKTLLSLRVAENLATDSRLVLFLVPSISLLSQALREWTREAEGSFHAFGVCSDAKIGKDQEDMSVHDLAIPATTSASRLVTGVKAVQGDGEMMVIFSTYQSIQVVSDAQRQGLAEFDVVICDEAHRTTGVTLSGADESEFVRAHQQDFIRAKKRLYMTATPRIYAEQAKTKAKAHDAVLCSMDDESLYGPVLHRLGFGEAVSRGLLCDYKVMVLAVDEGHVSRMLQRQLAHGGTELNLDDAVKIVGCWNGLSKKLGAGEDLG
ncbi:MAG: restriction endonuclease, partial [Sulfobacillus sp.]